jgi:hypothetical protein
MPQRFFKLFPLVVLVATLSVLMDAQRGIDEETVSIGEYEAAVTRAHPDGDRSLELRFRGMPISPPRPIGSSSVHFSLSGPSFARCGTSTDYSIAHSLEDAEFRVMDSDLFVALGPFSEQSETVAQWKNGDDITGDGVPDLVVTTDSGGSNGVGGIAILQLDLGNPEPQVRELFNTQWSHGRLCDLDADGVMELRMQDNTYHFVWNRPNAMRPIANVVLRWTGSGYDIAPALMHRTLVSGDRLRAIAERLKQELIQKAATTPDGTFRNLSAVALQLIYTGNQQAAWWLIDHAWPEEMSGRESYRQGVITAVTDSAYGAFMLAEDGHAMAQDAVGHKYWAGNRNTNPSQLPAGVEQDLVLAHMWLSLAASENQRYLRPIDFSRLHVANISDELTLLEATMTSAQITEAQRLAREWDEAHPRD